MRLCSEGTSVLLYCLKAAEAISCSVASFRAFRLCLQLDRSDVFCLKAFRPLGDVELDCLAFLQATKAPGLDG
jgi:hypothetical protein